jgi:hypothetical protein
VNPSADAGLLTSHSPNLGRVRPVSSFTNIMPLQMKKNKIVRLKFAEIQIAGDQM